MELLVKFGPLAQPYAKTLIRLQKTLGEEKWDGYRMRGEVGGVEILNYLIEVLPRIDVEVAKLQADPATPKGFHSDDPRGWWFDSQQAVQAAIDRWAGRTFANNAERIALWKANRAGDLSRAPGAVDPAGVPSAELRHHATRPVHRQAGLASPSRL